MQTRWWWVGLAALAAVAPLQAESANVVGLVTAVQGEVQLANGHKVHMLTLLQPDDRIVVGDAATVSVTLVPSGKHVTVTGPQTATVSADALSARNPEEMDGRPYPPDLLGDLKPPQSGTNPPFLTFNSPPELKFDYLADSNVRIFEVRIRTTKDERTLLNLPPDVHRVTLNEAELSRYNDGPGAPVTIRPQQRYLVDITAQYNGAPARGATYCVYLQAKSEMQSLDHALLDARRDVAAHPDDTTAYALLGALYESQHCYRIGMDEMRTQARRDPDNADYLDGLEDALSRAMEDTTTQAIQAHDNDAFNAPF